MKKKSLSNQLLLISISVALVAAFIFSLITIIYSSNISRVITYNNLEEAIYFINFDNKEELNKYNQMDIGMYIEDNTDKYFNSSRMNFINESDISGITFNEKISKGVILINNNRIYYVYYNDNNVKKILFTDSNYSFIFIRQIFLNIVLIFFLIILGIILILYLWSNRLTVRINRLQKHILTLNKNNYNKAYVDDGKDEIGDLSRSIEKMRDEIVLNDKTKQEMLHNISHDFKTPIAVIKSYAEAVDDGVVDNNEAIKKIIEQADLLKKKVNRLIEYNRLEYFEKDIEFKQINIYNIINDIVSNYKYQLNNINFELNIEEIYFSGIEENWYNVIDNIIDNAKRYAVSIIKITLNNNGLIIYNDGENINPDLLDNMFKPYEKGSKGQFGLGMSIVKKTIDYFGYNLEVINENVGVSFIIRKR